MRPNPWMRALDHVAESCWLLALVAVPIFFDTMTVRIFEPDKIVLFRNIVLVMVLATLVRAILTAPAAMARAPTSTSSLPSTGREVGDKSPPWWRRQITRRPMVIPVIIFTLVYTAATIHSVLPGISFWGSYDRMQGLYTWLNYIALFFVLVYSVRSWAQIERIVSAFVFASVPVAIYGIMQHMQWDPVQWGADTTVRVASTLGNAIFLGAYLLMCMPFAMYRLWRAAERLRAPHEQMNQRGDRARRDTVSPSRSRRRPRQKDVIEVTGLPPIVPVVGYALVLVLDFAALYFTGSRGPYYGFVAAVFLLGLPLTLKWHTPYPAIASIVVAMALVAFPGIISALNPALAAFILVASVALGVAILASSRLAQALSAGSRSTRWALVGIALVIAIFAFPQAVNVLSPATQSVAADAQHLTSFQVTGTAEVRQYIWKGSLPLIAHRAILGWGPETMIYVYSPYYPSGLGHIERSNAAPDRNHDVWLDFLVFSGVLGLLVWLGVLAAFAFVILTVLRRARSRRATLLASTILAVVAGHLVEASVGIPVVSTLMLLWTLFGLATVLYARRELIGEDAFMVGPTLATREPAPAAAARSSASAPVAADAVTAAARGRDRGARDAVTRREGGGNGSRANARASGRAAIAPAGPRRADSVFARLSGPQQTLLLGLVVLTLGVFAGSSWLFATNVQVVRADAAYKQGQAYDGAASACLLRAQNPADPAAAACPVGSQYTPGQIAQYAGMQLLPIALGYYQQAIGDQPNQDMYYLWMAKTYLDQAHYDLMVRQQANAIASFQNAETLLLAARKLNPHNADHPMNLARMFAGWARIDPSKWKLADKYFGLAISPHLAWHNGRWADEWGNADMTQAATRPGLTPVQRTALYRQALAAFQHACKVDDLLGDARVYRGDAYQALGMHRQAAASYAEALKIGGFEQFAPASPTMATPPAVVQRLVSALYSAHAYRGLVQPAVQLLPPSLRTQAPSYLRQSPITLAYSPTLGLGAPSSPFSQTLRAISSTLRQKGLVP
jgi:O-antigen ligase/tetratricopeptide (TPR) repeat protein